VKNSAEWMRRIRKFAFEKVRSMKRTMGYDFLGDINSIWHTFGYSVGMMDEFYNLKSGESVKNVRRYNSATVLLSDIGSKFNVYAGEHKKVRFSISNFAGDVKDGAMSVSLLQEQNNDKKCVWSAEKKLGEIRNGDIKALGEFDVPFPLVNKPMKYILSVSFAGGQVKAENEWEMYAFPKRNPLANVKHQFRQVTKISREELIAAMERGERLLLLGAGPFNSLSMSFRIGLAGRCGGNYATVIKSQHPLFTDFPHEGFCGWQFRTLLEGARTVQLEGGVKFDPIVEVVSSDKYLIRQSVLFEYKVGKGRLAVCSLKFRNDDPAALWLKAALEDYVASDDFAPNTTLSVDDLKSVLDAPRFSGDVNNNRALNPNDPSSRIKRK
jgi:hypothetical protein